MARIEKNASVEKKLQEVKGDVLREVKLRNRRRHPWLTCSLIALFLLASFFVWIVWLVAATGLVQIPLFTQLAYQSPEPVRSVEAGAPVEVLLQERFTTLLTQRLYEGEGTLENRAIELSIPEASLTASARTLLAQTDVPTIDPAQVQVVIDPSVGIELYAPVRESSLGTAVTVNFSLEATEGNVAITPTSVEIGSLGIPAFVLTGFFQPLIEQQLRGINEELSGYAQIDAIGITEGALMISGEIAVELQEAS